MFWGDKKNQFVIFREIKCNVLSVVTFVKCLDLNSLKFYVLKISWWIRDRGVSALQPPVACQWVVACNYFPTS